jgi:hypothetical protein
LKSPHEGDKGDMMPLPKRPSNQKWRVCPAKAGPVSDISPARRSARRFQMQAAASQRSIQKRMKAPIRPGLTLIICTVCGAGFGPVSLLAEEKPETSAEYQREELGINPYTAPSVADIFQQLDDLKPLPFELLKRDFPQAMHAGREQMGLVFGGLIADGFLIVECQKQNLVEDLGRVLLRQARSLGVGDRVMRHSASLTDLGKRGDWTAVRKELIATQNDVEQAMSALRDQKMAHLISLGGWLRGLEITSGAVEAKYSPERAAVLWQRDLINYFAEEMKTLPPPLARTPLFEKLHAGIAEIRNLLNHAPPDKMSEAEVKALHAQARELTLAIVAGQ